MRTSSILLFTFLTHFLSAQVATAPPPFAKLRTMAEWEEVSQVMVAWRGYESVLTEIIRAAREECEVVVVCNSETDRIAAQTALTNANVDLSSNVNLLVAPVNTIWSRDYGPQNVYANDVDSLLLVDWIYNRNRPKDDTLALRFAAEYNLPLYRTLTAPYDLVNTGGNFMSDGCGTGFASDLIFRNNDQTANGEGSNPNDLFGTSNHDETTINDIMSDFMGINRYIKMEELPFDGIHHIDMHMKLLDEETLLIGKYPDGVSDGPQIEANLQFVLSNHLSVFGTPYRVVRLNMPPTNGQYPPLANAPARYPTYINALFVNKSLIMPSYNQTALNNAARDTMEKYLPGYNIVQVNCNSIIDLGGAVHCITKEIGSRDPLRFVHQSVKQADNGQPDTYKLRALVQHKSGIEQVQARYRVQPATEWLSVDLTAAANNEWTGAIPVQAQGAVVEYYLTATANSGKTMQRPMPAPEGFWTFDVISTSDVANIAPLNAVMSPIYPNPAQAITCIPVQSNRAQFAQIRLLNSVGQVQQSIFNGQLPAGNSHYFIHADRLSSGIYFVEMQSEAGRVVQKLTVR
jgi:agmatine deiminase